MAYLLFSDEMLEHYLVIELHRIQFSSPLHSQTDDGILA